MSLKLPPSRAHLPAPGLPSRSTPSHHAYPFSSRHVCACSPSRRVCCTLSRNDRVSALAMLSIRSARTTCTPTRTAEHSASRHWPTLARRSGGIWACALSPGCGTRPSTSRRTSCNRFTRFPKRRRVPRRQSCWGHLSWSVTSPSSSCAPLVDQSACSATRCWAISSTATLTCWTRSGLPCPR